MDSSDVNRRRASGSCRTESWFRGWDWKKAVEGAFWLNATQKSLLKEMARWADEHGICFPRQSEIGKVVGLSRENVNRNLRVAEAHGMITRHGRNGRSSILELHPPEEWIAEPVMQPVTEGVSEPVTPPVTHPSPDLWRSVTPPVMHRHTTCDESSHITKKYPSKEPSLGTSYRGQGPDDDDSPSWRDIPEFDPIGEMWALKALMNHQHGASVPTDTPGEDPCPDRAHWRYEEWVRAVEETENDSDRNRLLVSFVEIHSPKTFRLENCRDYHAKVSRLGKWVRQAMKGHVTALEYLWKAIPRHRESLLKLAETLYREARRQGMGYRAEGKAPIMDDDGQARRY